MLDNFRKKKNKIMSTSRPTEKKARKRRLNALEVVRLQTLCRDRLVAELYEQKAYPGMPIPGVKTLSEQYAIPISVVRSTLNALRTEGILASVPREGMKVISLPQRPQSLKGIRIAMIGWLDESCPESIYNRSAVIAGGMDPVLNSQGGKLDFFNLWKQKNPEEFVHRLLHSGYDALIDTTDFTNEPTSFQKEYKESRIPCICTEPNSGNSDYVCFDNEQIGRLIARHALELGHRRTVFYHHTRHYWSEERLQGVRNEFADWGVPPPDVLEYPFFNREEDDFVFRHFDQILQGKYTFVMASNDHLASRIFLAAERYQLKIPEVFSLCGVDDLLSTRDLNLTTVPLRPMELGLAALDLLKKRLFMPESCAKTEKILIKTQLIVRNTTTQNTGEV